MRFIIRTFARPLLTPGVKTGIHCNTETKKSPKLTFQKQGVVPATLLPGFSCEKHERMSSPDDRWCCHNHSTVYDGHTKAKRALQQSALEGKSSSEHLR